MFRIAKKEEPKTLVSASIRISAILVALLLSGLMIKIMGYNPIEAFSAMVKGSLGSLFGIKNSINIAISYLITALGISIAFRMKYWNIGAEGQIIMGALFSTYIARIMNPDSNGALLIVLMTLAGMIGGAIWALIPGIFKAISNTNETLFTLMMNYIAIKLTMYLRMSLWKDPKAFGFPRISPIPEQSQLPKIFDINIGWIIALVLALIVHIFIKYTKKGYEISVVGESENTAHYAGINVKKVLILGIALSGALAGIAGSLKLTGISYSLTESIGGGDGFTAIIIAWLANLSTPLMALISLMFAALKQGGMAIEAGLNIPSSVAEIMQGMILFAALGSEFFIRYKVIYDNKNKYLTRIFNQIRNKDKEIV